MVVAAVAGVPFTGMAQIEDLSDRTDDPPPPGTIEAVKVGARRPPRRACSSATFAAAQPLPLSLLPLPPLPAEEEEE